MTLRFSARTPLALPLALALFAGCGGQIDGSVFDPTTDAATGDDASVKSDSTPVVPDGTPIGADTSPGQPDTELPPTDTGPNPPPAGDVGTPCTSNAQCNSAHCSGGRCTTTCNSAGDCVSGWYCSQTTTGKLCRCTPSGADCGGQDKNCDGVVTSNAPCTAPPPVDAGPPPADAAVACTTCAQSSCGTETNACFGDATCSNFLKCVQACPSFTGTCITQCENKNNDAATQTFVSCMLSKCSGCT